MAKKIEVFTADCPLCKDALEMVREEACSKCEIVERRCSGDECCGAAKEYNIKAVPTVVVDGEITIVGKPTREQVKEIFA